MRGLLTAAVVAGALLAGGGPAVGSGEGALAVLDAEVAFHAPPAGEGAGATGSVTLRGALLGPEGFMAFDPVLMQATASLGPSVLSGALDPGAVTRVKRPRSGGWVATTRRAFGGRGRMVLRVDDVSGRFEWRARGFPAEELLASGPGQVPVALRLGEAAWAESVDFEEARPGKRWTFRRTIATRPPPGSGGGSPGPGQGFTTLEKGDFSGISVFTFRVAADRASFDALWAAHSGGGAAPDVDFSREMVVGVWLGDRPTGGYGVTITSAIISRILGVPGAGPGVAVEAREDAPGPACIVTQAVTRPFHVIRMPRAADGSMLSLVRVVADCP